MSGTVARLLAAGAEAEYARVLALKLMLLDDTLREGGEGGRRLADRLAVSLRIFAGLSLDRIVALGTPFFWQGVHQMALRREDEEEQLAPLADSLEAAAFDSFFDHLPDGTALAFDAAPRGLSLPRLGVRIPPTDGELWLRREGPFALAVESPGSLSRIDLRAVEPPFALARFPIGSDPVSYLLAARDSGLFTDDCLTRLQRSGPFTDPGFASEIAGALDVIHAVDPLLGARLCALIHWYFPLGTPPGKVDNAFSSSDLVGAIFLSQAYRGLLLVETLVHEFHHNELYTLIEGNPLFETRPGEVFYSPWRTDPRPLEGLFHALHVFSELARFYALAESAPALASQREEIRGRRQVIWQQLRVGLAQVPEKRLSSLGRDVIRAIAEQVERQRPELTPTPAAEEQQEAHLAAWLARHPHLVSKLNRPLDFGARKL